MGKRRGEGRLAHLPQVTSSEGNKQGHILGLLGRQSLQGLLLGWMWCLKREGQVTTDICPKQKEGRHCP